MAPPKLKTVSHSHTKLTHPMHRLSLLTLFLFLFLFLLIMIPTQSQSHSQPVLPNDAASLLTFKSKADLDNTLLFTLHEHLDYCHWQGVKCQQGRVVRFSLPSHHLRGTFPPNSLTLLSHLRVLVLRNNSLSGPLPPSFSSLPNLRSLLLDHNLFSSLLPPSLSSLPHLRVLDLSFNHFHGPLPTLNSSSLSLLNLSSNNFSGTIPQPLSRFPPSAFSLNPNLCGDVINKPCVSPPSPSPFFDSSSATPPSDDDTASFLSPPQTTSHRKKRLIILAFSMGGLLVVSSFLCMIFTAKRKTTTTMRRKDNTNTNNNVAQVATVEPEVVTVRLATSQSSDQLKEKCKELVQGEGGGRREKRGGDLVFCSGEVKQYTLEQLMRGSAEMLGRGTMGTTYKAKLDNQLILTVKRLDAFKLSGIDGEMFERVLDTVGGMRHPNIVPVRAYFQANDERLIIFDYQPNGSVFNLIHGSRSTRAKPLHWTSCLKIAEDVAQGLAYIHQASKLIHGNLKASNVLLGADFEACVTDYCLSALSATSYSDNEDPDSARYRGPEARNSAWKLTPKMDVYAFGVLLLELLSGKPPSQHPFLAPHDMLDWVKSMRGDDDTFEDNHLTMLVEVASLCSLTSPEQRPPMWQVLKMIQKIKASVGSDDAVDSTTVYQ